MFEQAARMKLRFATSAGTLTVEDLWDLPLTSKTGKPNLDDIAKDLHEVVSDNEVSFVEKPAPRDKGALLGFEIVKHIIKVLVEERDAAKAAIDKKAKKQKILEILAAKQDDKLKEATPEQLQKMLEDL